MNKKTIPWLAYHIADFTFNGRIKGDLDLLKNAMSERETFRSKLRELFQIRHRCRDIK